MATFTVRVELHNVIHDTSPYTILHDSMKEKGFTNTVRSSKGVVYKMPPAEYNYSGKKNIDEIFNLVRDALATTKVNGSIFITQSINRRWSNLDEADSSELMKHLIAEAEELLDEIKEEL